jgi:serine/threonine protein kinase/tetratricopeptide (TPR) repeat protein
MGRVFVAEGVHDRQRVALKFLRPDRNASPRYLQRFEREATLLARIQHENVVSLLATGVDEANGPFLVLEYVRGVTLRGELDLRGVRSVERLLRIVQQVSRGLSHAHALGVVHRDLKPENVMLAGHAAGDVLVKLLDFGVAGLRDDEAGYVTQSDAIIGTAGYMAPEQARGERALDARTDVYSLGVVVYEALCGRRPYTGSSYNETLFKILHRKHRPLIELRPDLPIAFSHAVERALAKDVAARFPSVELFMREIENAAGSTQSRTSRGLHGTHEERLQSDHPVDLTLTEIGPDSVLRPLYDRSFELKELRRLAADCLATSSTRLALITGAAGIGKTRLVEEVCSEWRERGLPSLSVSCLEGDASPALWPWQCLLGEIGAVHSPPQAAPVAGADSAVSKADRYRYFVSVRQELEDASRRSALLIVLENLHLADDATLTLLQFLTTAVRPAPILFIGTGRTPLVPPNDRALEGLAHQGHVLSLGPLGDDASLRLLRNVLGDSRDPGLEAEAVRHAGGNPLFVREIALGLKARPDRANEILRSSGPSAIRDSIRWHLSALDEPTQDLLRTAAVFGEVFDVHRLAAALDSRVPTVLEKLTAPVRFDVLRALSPFDFTFCHALFRQYLYNTLTEVDRRRIHWKIGTTMLEVHEDDSARGLSQIAHHLAAGAVDGEQPAQAAKIGRRSADACMERFAFEVAASEYRRTLRLAETAGSPVSERVGLMIRAADCYRFLGQPDDARTLANDAGLLARAHGDGVGQGEALIARVRSEFDVFGCSPALVDDLQAAVAAVGHANGRLRARLLAQLAVSLCFTPQAARRKAACAEALALADGADEKTQAFVLAARWRVHWGVVGDKSILPEWIEEALAAARRANEPELELECLWVQVVLALQCGLLDIAEQRAELALRLAERVKNSLIPYLAKVRTAGLAIFRGDPDAAERCLEAREHGKPMACDFVEDRYYGQVFVLAYEFDRVAEVLPQLSAIADSTPALPAYRAFVALGWAMLGERERALAAYEAALSPESPFGENNTTFAFLTVAAELCAFLGDHDRADGLYAELAPLSDRLAITGAFYTVPGIPAYALSRLAGLRGDRESAFRHAKEARDLAVRFRSTRWAARCDALVQRIESGGKFEGWTPRSLTA